MIGSKWIPSLVNVQQSVVASNEFKQISQYHIILKFKKKVLNLSKAGGYFDIKMLSTQYENMP